MDWLYQAVAVVAVLLVAACCFAQHAEDDAALPARINFNHYKTPSRYGYFDVRRDFNTVLSWGTVWPYQRVKVVSAPAPRDRVLRVRYPKGKVRTLNSGAVWYWEPFRPRQNLVLSFWVYFPENFEFRQGGKLHGLIGGRGNTGGHKPIGSDGWSVRFIWAENASLALYIYHPDQRQKWGDTFYFSQTPNRFVVTAKGYDRLDANQRLTLSTGKWHYLQMQVRVNTPGKRNGEVRARLDYRLAIEVTGLAFRDETCEPDELLIRAMYFCTFFGGRSDAYRPTRDQYLLFDDFMLSSERPPFP